MKRIIERKYLLISLLIVSFGFMLLSLGLTERALTTNLVTNMGLLDISGYCFHLFPNGLLAAFFVAIFLLAHFILRWRLPQADPYILPAVALLCGIGCIMVFRLSPDLAIARNEVIKMLLSRNPDAQVTQNVLALAKLGVKHIYFIALGLVVMIAPSLLSQNSVTRISAKKYLWVLISAFLVFITLMLGDKINGKRLWLFGVQTGELIKLLMILFMAGYIYERGKGIAVFGRDNIRAWAQYAAPFLVMCFFGLLPLVIQRDFGPTFLFFVVFLLMFHFSGNRNIVTLIFIILVGIAGYISYKTGYPYIVRERFDMMFDPFGHSENMARVLWAISSGGMFGSGIGYGQPQRIPEVQSDFSFAAICEEIGFIGAFSVILVYVVLLIRCFRIAAGTENVYMKTLVLGIATMIGMQVFIIIAGNLGGIPLTGITLPLVSYGGSSLLVNFLMIGIVLTVSHREAK
jgi:cell division protein FtsW (lipid II flippase)